MTPSGCVERIQQQAVISRRDGSVFSKAQSSFALMRGRLSEWYLLRLLLGAGKEAGTSCCFFHHPLLRTLFLFSSSSISSPLVALRLSSLRKANADPVSLLRHATSRGIGRAPARMKVSCHDKCSRHLGSF